MPHPHPVLPRFPEPEAAPALSRALREACRSAGHTGQLVLPAAPAIEPLALARWLYRAWLIDEGRWAPLVHVDRRHLAGDPAALDDTTALARTGWLVLTGGEAPAELVRACRARDALLVTAGQEAVDVPRAVASRVRRLDHDHLWAADPTLAHVRASLLAHARSGSTVHVSGPAGTGKARLVQWAHARTDDRPLSVVRGEEVRVVDGQWRLFEEVGELSDGGVDALRRELLARVASAPPSLGVASAWTRRPRHPAFAGIVGESPPLCEVLGRVLQVAPTALPVLILGEPGVGKESLARAVHDASGRKGRFVAVDLGALPEHLAESELFGHRKGAFTGADRDREGMFRRAHGGTVFLDELGNLAPRLQAKLLRVLQERVVQPVGDDRAWPVDVRVVAATNADPDGMATRGQFRRDLLGRLDAVTLRLPPLRERLDDVPLLARHLLTGLRGADPGDHAFTEAALTALRGHRWPGNVRELGNVVGYAAAVAPPDGPIDAVHLGPLAPGAQRVVPLFTLSSVEPRALSHLPLERRLLQAMTAVTLRVGALRDRGEAAVRHAILSLLDGRPIRADALGMLQAQPWWGELPELQADLAALCACPPGPIDRAALTAALPHRVHSVGQAPIRLLLAPSRREDGGLTGLTRDVDAGGVVIGRLGSLTELRAESAAEPRVSAWLSTLHQLAGGGALGCLDLSLLPRMSRVQAVITRTPQGLAVHALPGTRLALRAGTLTAGAPPALVTPGRPVVIGDAGELALIAPGRAEPYVQLFALSGPVAADVHADEILSRVSRGSGAQTLVQTTAPTASGPVGRPAPANALLRGLRVWELTPAQAAALNDIVAAYDGGEFKAHIHAAAAALGDDPALTRLVAYLRNAPRVAQYVSRLYALDANAAAGEDLARRLDALPDGESRKAALPKGLRELLG